MTRAADGGRVLSKALALRYVELGRVRFPASVPGDVVPCYVEDFPSGAPDELVLIRMQQGFPATDISGYENPELEVIYRTPVDAGVQAGFDGAEALRRAVKDDGQIVWAANTEHEVDVAYVNADATPSKKGQDPKGRPVWSFSLQIHALEAHQ